MPFPCSAHPPPHPAQPRPPGVAVAPLLSLITPNPTTIVHHQREITAVFSVREAGKIKRSSAASVRWCTTDSPCGLVNLFGLQTKQTEGGGPARSRAGQWLSRWRARRRRGDLAAAAAWAGGSRLPGAGAPRRGPKGGEGRVSEEATTGRIGQQSTTRQIFSRFASLRRCDHYGCLRFIFFETRVKCDFRPEKGLFFLARSRALAIGYQRWE